MKFPLMLRKTHYKITHALKADFDARLAAVKKNAEGLLEEYNLLEKHKDKFVQQNLELRSALKRSEEQVAELTVELSKATKNDHRDEKGRFTPAGHPPAPGTSESVAQGFEDGVHGVTKGSGL